jgi:hypothetical protein
MGDDYDDRYDSLVNPFGEDMDYYDISEFILWGGGSWLIFFCFWFLNILKPSSNSTRDFWTVTGWIFLPPIILILLVILYLYLTTS